MPLEELVEVWVVEWKLKRRDIPDVRAVVNGIEDAC